MTQEQFEEILSVLTAISENTEEIASKLFTLNNYTDKTNETLDSIYDRLTDIESTINRSK